jgi:hypothetical protein
MNRPHIGVKKVVLSIPLGNHEVRVRFPRRSRLFTD